jgi:hypothetical protein
MDNKLPRHKAAMPSARVHNAMLDAVRALQGLGPAVGFGDVWFTDDPFGRAFDFRRVGPVLARITGGGKGAPYTWEFAFGAPGGQWITELGEPSNAYELNDFQDVPYGKVVELYPGVEGDWRFQYRRQGGTPCEQVCVTVQNLCNFSDQQYAVGATVILIDQDGNIVDQCLVNDQGYCCLDPPDYGQYWVSVSKAGCTMIGDPVEVNVTCNRPCFTAYPDPACGDALVRTSMRVQDANNTFGAQPTWGLGFRGTQYPPYRDALSTGLGKFPSTNTWDSWTDCEVAVGTADVTQVAALNGIATLSTTAPHHFHTGAVVVVEGLTTTRFNGTWTILYVPDATSFAFNVDPPDLDPAGDQGTATVALYGTYAYYFYTDATLVYLVQRVFIYVCDFSDWDIVFADGTVMDYPFTPNSPGSAVYWWADFVSQGVPDDCDPWTMTFDFDHPVASYGDQNQVWGHGDPPLGQVTLAAKRAVVTFAQDPDPVSCAQPCPIPMQDLILDWTDFQGKTGSIALHFTWDGYRMLWKSACQNSRVHQLDQGGGLTILGFNRQDCTGFQFTIASDSLGNFVIGYYVCNPYFVRRTAGVASEEGSSPYKQVDIRLE